MNALPTRESSARRADGPIWHGIVLQPRDLNSSLELVSAAVAARHSSHVHLCNAWTMVLACSVKDSQLKRVLQCPSAINLVDGVPLARSLAWSNRVDAAVTRGPDLFDRSVPILARQGARQMLFGGTPETLQRLRLHFAQRGVSGQSLAGYAPPFRELDATTIDEYVERMLAAGVDVVWVGLGTPKQDVLARRAAEAGIPCVCVGAAFDFAAGVVSQAPRCLRESGFEWLYRMAMEPRRLAGRYVVGNVRFVDLALRHHRALRARSASTGAGLRR
ncbi:exopolysaccharide biosynthesis WecB/TagA/CpsF family protein [Ilumatobacter fluminis]|uniref:Exopolysaccharide biosynthesis WecB/TagA/CpsF family protein n=1 Tax=Ilumatobacter fluminis TaxID=467091 RepID=A0A4R7I4A5_9ACTN|nr:exopolysaccharide biosynthesis WecB/TagA/CpsF family protein [Ilumatobacter fluminis]